MRETVAKVYSGRSLTSRTFTKVTISQVITARITRPRMKLIAYLRTFHSPA
jgi:hypothetical protein